MVGAPIFDSDNETVLGGEDRDDLDQTLFQQRRNETIAKADMLIEKLHAVFFCVHRECVWVPLVYSVHFSELDAFEYPLAGLCDRPITFPYGPIFTFRLIRVAMRAIRRSYIFQRFAKKLIRTISVIRNEIRAWCFERYAFPPDRKLSQGQI